MASDEVDPSERLVVASNDGECMAGVSACVTNSISAFHRRDFALYAYPRLMRHDLTQGHLLYRSSTD